jgi:hypothetical protein
LVLAAQSEPGLELLLARAGWGAQELPAAALAAQRAMWPARFAVRKMSMSIQPAGQYRQK